jgi:hypothetical protein
VYSNDETESRKRRAGQPQILQVCVVLAFECRARIAGSDKILINSSSRSMFFSPISFPELIVSNEVYVSGPPGERPGYRLLSQCASSWYYRHVFGKLMENLIPPRYSKPDRVVDQSPSCF